MGLSLLRYVQVHDYRAVYKVIRHGCHHQSEPALFSWRMTGIFDRKALYPAAQHRPDPFGNLVGLE
jgi:hypothetical protein